MRPPRERYPSFAIRGAALAHDQKYCVGSSRLVPLVLFQAAGEQGLGLLH